MNRTSKADTEKSEMKVTVQGYQVTLCFEEKPNSEIAAWVKQTLLDSYTISMNCSRRNKLLLSFQIRRGVHITKDMTS